MIGITIVSFVVMHLAPGDPTSLVTDLNPQASQAAKKRLTEIYGLDRPLHEQYWSWVKNLATLDLGRSMATARRPVRDKIAERLPVTLALNVRSMGIIIMVSVPLGLFSAVRAGGWFDRSATVAVFILFAAPSFWLALLGM